MTHCCLWIDTTLYWPLKSVYHNLKVCEQRKKKNFKKADFVKMYRLIKNINYNSLHNCCDVNESVARFYKNLNDILIECVPMSTQVGKVFGDGIMAKLLK